MHSEITNKQITIKKYKIMTNQIFTIAEKIEIHTARVNEYTREAEAFAKVGDEKRAQNCRRIVENHRAQIAKLQAEADARITEELADVANDEQGDTMTAEDVELFAAQVSTPNAFVSACKVLAVRARQMFAKVAHGAKVATSKAVALAAVVLCLAVGIGAMVGSMYVCGQVGEACEASGVVLPAALRIVLSVAFLFTFVLDFSCWAELQIMRIFEKCHAFAGFGGIYYRGEENGVFVRPFSVIGRLVHEMRTA